MNFLKILVCMIGLSAGNLFAQPFPTDHLIVEDLPVATIDENFFVTLDTSIPMEEYYKIDISHLTFENEAEALVKFGSFLRANLVNNVVFYEEEYVILRVYTEYIAADLDHEKMQVYLNHLTKP